MPKHHSVSHIHLIKSQTNQPTRATKHLRCLKNCEFPDSIPPFLNLDLKGGFTNVHCEQASQNDDAHRELTDLLK